jgi:hypothetical protein
MPAAEILRGGELLEVAVGAGLGLGAIIAFAVGLRAFIGASENWRRGQAAVAVAFGTLGTLAFGLALAGTAYGLIVIARDGPLS